MDKQQQYFLIDADLHFAAKTAVNIADRDIQPNKACSFYCYLNISLSAIQLILEVLLLKRNNALHLQFCATYRCQKMI